MTSPSQSQFSTGYNTHSIYWNTDTVFNALQYLDSHQTIFLNHLTALLNEYHGWERSPAYYDLLCGEWLMHFTHVVYAAYLEVVQGVAISPEQNSIFVFAEHNDYQQTAVNNSLFTEQLRQCIAKMLNSTKSLDFQFDQTVCSVGQRQTSLRSQLRQKTVGGSGFLSKLGKNNAPFVFCRPSVKCSPLEWIATMWKWRKWARQDIFDYPIEVTAEIDVNWRRKNAASISGENFTDIFCAILPLYIPTLYMEAFSDYRQKAHALNLHRPEAIYTTNSLHGHILFKVLVADWREDGTRLLSHQHGGGYGLGLIEPNENYEIRVVDRFYTFGWDGKVEKVKYLSPNLRNSIYKPPQQSRVLLNLLTMPKNLYRIHFAGMPGTSELMDARMIDFVRDMMEEPEFVVRLYHTDYGKGLMEILLGVNPNLHFDDMSTPGPVSYASSSLVIHNYLGTSWLETLAMNIPTICFYESDIYAFRDDAQPYIDSLVAVGVLHESTSEASKFALSVKNNPQDWWQKPEVQAARLNFIQNYANYSPDWASQWEAEFRELID